MIATDKEKYVHNEVVHNLISPRIIVPYLTELLKPASVADVGCGTGTFLKVFKELGVGKVLGIDGEWVKLDQLHISNDEFIKADLEKPLNIEETFDLVLCLEVAEHLLPASAETFIESVVSLGKMVVFSAAVPYQGGQNHLNEQPFSYWQDLFKKHGYYFYDVFREKFWNNKKVDWWYKQNMFLVIHESVMPSEIIKSRKIKGEAILQIHPDLLQLHVKQKESAIQKNNYLQAKIEKIRSGEEIWKVYASMLIKKIRKIF